MYINSQLTGLTELAVLDNYIEQVPLEFAMMYSI